MELHHPGRKVKCSLTISPTTVPIRGAGLSQLSDGQGKTMPDLHSGGAAYGNRTHTVCLEGRCAAVTLMPQETRPLLGAPTSKEA